MSQLVIVFGIEETMKKTLKKLNRSRCMSWTYPLAYRNSQHAAYKYSKVNSSPDSMS